MPDDSAEASGTGPQDADSGTRPGSRLRPGPPLPGPIVAACDYRCRDGETAFEVRREVTAAAGPVRCPDGHADIARVWSAVAIGGRA